MNVLYLGFLLSMLAATPVFGKVDLNMFQGMKHIFKGAPTDRPRTSYLPDRPERIRIFKNGVLQVDPYAETAEEKEPPKQDFHAFWKHVDADSSGVLTMDEFVASMATPLADGTMSEDHPPEMFNLADVDGSGDLTFEEVRTFLHQDQGYDPVVKESEAIDGSEAKFDMFWEQIDKDADMIMQREEFENSMRGAVESGHMPVEKMNEMFVRMDSDGDGQVTKAEAKGEIKQQMQTAKGQGGNQRPQEQKPEWQQPPAQQPPAGRSEF